VSNKELANIMNVDYTTLMMKKYRLKKKLNLSKDDDLEEFITKLSPNIPDS
jgi:DNA-binding CsgD family transcriptional regulator